MVCEAIAGEHVKMKTLGQTLKKAAMGTFAESPAERKTISHKQSQVSVVTDATLKNYFLFWVVYTLQVEKPSVLEEGWFYASLMQFPQPACVFT